MDHADGVQRLQRFADLNAQVHKQVNLQRVLFHHCLERSSFQILHHQEGNAICSADIVDGANARQVQSGCGARLAMKTLEGLRVASHLFRQEFQRHDAAELQVLGAVHHSHAAASDALKDAVVANYRAGPVGFCHKRAYA